MLTLDFSTFPILETERLLLRAMTPSDVPALFELRTDPLVNRYIDRLPTALPEDALRFIEKIGTGIHENLWIYWAITEKGDDRLIGTICLWNFVPTDHKAELGYELRTASQGKGFMSEAVAAVLSYGFEILGLEAVEAGVHPMNAPSVKVLKRAGFALIGTFQDTHLTGDAVEMLIYEKKR
ncbi:GNAT family N-acetyltransferase [Acidaminobacter hydrogenoformans]|uniref:Ribosomal-protein-alanine N-acetyltransferase n=1 Tax=Acidaminobacter hydrogenoformans DSM 2784 TaxID=1120920 RepID=A0A1G5S877_9FIRM|nr:GNAT family N-acetyltransferase [Acidaminobacter hydrogenoformans]SCZ82110.1 ribosomal-protein-alanine N-acetyltransferase [Acidaminobacter hydrogenoformans DSM 2784]